jgi:hypothetical protein
VALVLIELRRDKPDEAKAALEELLADKDRRIPQVTALTAGPKLERVAALRPLVIQFYERSLSPDEEFQYTASPARRLVSLYREENRKEDARQLLLKYADRQMPKRVSAIDQAGIQAQDRLEIAKQLEDLGCPLDALLLYRRMQETPSNRVFSSRMPSNMGAVVRKEIARLEASLPPESILALLPDAAKLAAAGKPAGPAIDFMIQIDRGESGEAKLASPIAKALKATADKPELRQQASERLAPLAKARPEDLSVAVAAALLELASGKPEQQTHTVGRVIELIDKRPLAPADDPAKLTDAQRAEAVEQFSVVLVAMACLGNEQFKSQTEKLAGRALDAAWRHPKKELASVVLARLGPQALAQSDPVAVRQRLQQVLQSLLAPSDSRSKPGGAKPVSPESFDQIADLAQCAANAGLADLSLDCMRQALQAGPPAEAGQTGPYASRSDGEASQAVVSPEVSAKVEQALARLNGCWTEQKVPAATVYETLAAVVLPESRPETVWLYANRSTGGFEKWRSVGDLLAQRAVEAGKAEELKNRLSARKPNPQGELDCQVLQLQLALAGDDAAKASEILKQLSDRMQKKWTMDSARQLTPAAISALRHSATRPAAEGLIKQISSMLTGGSAWGDRLIEKTAIEDSAKKQP